LTNKKIDVSDLLVGLGLVIFLPSLLGKIGEMFVLFLVLCSQILFLYSLCKSEPFKKRETKEELEFYIGMRNAAFKLDVFLLLAVLALCNKLSYLDFTMGSLLATVAITFGLYVLNFRILVLRDTIREGESNVNI